MSEPGKHIVIIGGGIGGLVTGCLLSNEGYKITIIEKHNRIGGGLHSFERSGNLYESGIHYMSGFEENGVLRKLFNYLGIMDQIELMPMNDPFFDVIQIATDDRQFRIGKGKKNFVEQLSLSFPMKSKILNAILIHL
jgi:all-trans-retinol 13,14-reductase